MNWSDSTMAGACSASASCTAHWVVARQSAIEVGASTRRGASPCRPLTANDRSLCSLLAGMPVDGPPRITSTTTIGTSALTARPMRLGHQRQARAGGGRQRGHAAVGRADDHVDRGQFVLGLQQRAADLGQRRRHPFEQLGRRRDRVGGDEAHAAAHGAEAGGLVAADLPAPAGRRRRLCQAGQAVACRRPRPSRRAVPCRLACSAPRRVSSWRAARLRAPTRRDAGQAAGQAQREHVGPAAGNRLGHLLQRQRHAARAAGAEDLGHGAFVAVADHQAVRAQRNLVGEAVHVLPVHRQQQVEAVVQCVDRLCVPMRSRAAASPPRICGPLVRTIRPYRPARAAASSSIVPAVITPLPPLPAMAIDNEVAEPGRCTVAESALRVWVGAVRSRACMGSPGWGLASEVVVSRRQTDADQ